MRLHLIVDDGIDDAATVADDLCRWGHEVIPTVGMAQAVAGEPCDGIVIRLRNASGSGLDQARAIVRAGGLPTHTPILFVGLPPDRIEPLQREFDGRARCVAWDALEAELARLSPDDDSLARPVRMV